MVVPDVLKGAVFVSGIIIRNRKLPYLGFQDSGE